MCLTCILSGINSPFRSVSSGLDNKTTQLSMNNQPVKMGFTYRECGICDGRNSGTASALLSFLAEIRQYPIGAGFLST